MKILKKLIPAMVSAGILAVLVGIAGPGDLLRHLRDTRPGWLLLAALIYPGTLLLRWARFQILLRPTRAPGMGLLAVVALHNGLNKVLPARSGELGFLYLTERRLGVRLARGVSILLTARILDLACVGVLFLVASLAGPIDLERHGPSLIGAGSVGAVLLLGGAAALTRWGGLLAAWLAPRSQGGRLQRLLLGGAGRVAEALGEIRLVRSLLPAIGLSLALWILLYGLFTCVIRSMGFPLSYLTVVWGATAAVLTNVVPAGAVGNFGPHEAGWTLGFMLVGLTRDAAVATALVANLLFAAAALLFAGIGYLLLPPHRPGAPGVPEGGVAVDDPSLPMV